MTVILDYGMGNLRSVENAFKAIGADATIQSDLKGATRLLIPGVGAFGAAMERLSSLAADIRRAAEDGMPILGVCLGQQLLFERSEEFGEHAGLGLIDGDVVYFPRGAQISREGGSPAISRTTAQDPTGSLSSSVGYQGSDAVVKVPHVGWNALCYKRHDGIAAEGESGEQVYFVHSLVTRCANPADVVATTEHGIEFASIVASKNVWGCQFHPEKSGAVGLRMLRNFLAC